jgi:hypothetical protein
MRAQAAICVIPWTLEVGSNWKRSYLFWLKSEFPLVWPRNTRCLAVTQLLKSRDTLCRRIKLRCCSSWSPQYCFSCYYTIRCVTCTFWQHVTKVSPVASYFSLVYNILYCKPTSNLNHLPVYVVALSEWDCFCQEGAVYFSIGFVPLVRKF